MTQRIPARFLDNILSQLRQAGIVQAQRGKEGGYLLGRPACEVSVGEVIRVVQGPVSVIECAADNGKNTCQFRSGCVLLPLWEKAHQAMMAVYDGATFADLVEQERATALCEVIDYAI
jgi:Rrf2 family protein